MQKGLDLCLEWSHARHIGLTVHIQDQNQGSVLSRTGHMQDTVVRKGLFRIWIPTHPLLRDLRLLRIQKRHMKDRHLCTSKEYHTINYHHQRTKDPQSVSLRRVSTESASSRTHCVPSYDTTCVCDEQPAHVSRIRNARILGRHTPSASDISWPEPRPQL